MTQNHVIDPTYFYDAIEEFAFNYPVYHVTGKTIDDYGRVVSNFTTATIRGSLQSKGTTLNQSKDGNVYEKMYNFYCKSLYRIDIGDFIFYKNIWLHVESVNDYDEWGVRSCSLKMINLADYRDLSDYVKYINGEKIV